MSDAQRSMLINILSVIIDGVNYSSYLYIIAIGLTLIYGVMKILNMAHGTLYALGAYGAVVLVGHWHWNPYGSYLMLALAAVLVGLLAGPLIERGVLQFMYGKDEVLLLLVTFAISFILEDAIKLIWGVESYSIPDPGNLLGTFGIGNPDSQYYVVYPKYYILLVLVAVVVGVLLQWALKGTKNGKLLVAVIHDREVSTTLGINVKIVYMITFAVGAMLAGLGGALSAPTVSVSPSMGAEVIVLAFAVVVIGGLGSLVGAALGALIVGIVRSLAVHYVPQVELFSIYFVMALVLLIKPKGLFSGVEARKI
jgi:branched-chain amino acid transport system permease protein